jgi:hypothetical protein
MWLVADGAMQGDSMITYKVGFRFNLSAPLKTALQLAGWNAGKVAMAVEEAANFHLEGAELVVPKAGTKAAEREPIKLRGGKDGTVAIVAGVRYKIGGFPKDLQRLVDFNNALRDLCGDFEVSDDIIVANLPTWLQIKLAHMQAAEESRNQTLRRE